MNSEEQSHDSEPQAHGALRRKVLQRLVRAIVTGDLPAGSRLVVNKVAHQLGVSATPVREALQELEHSAIVELLHYRGAVVRPFGNIELREFYHVRGILESEAARLASGEIDSSCLEHFRISLERLVAQEDGSDDVWFAEMAMLDAGIHQVVAEFCGNRRLACEIARYHLLGESFRELIGNERRKHLRAVAFLINLVDAVAAADGDGAAKAMSHHIRCVAEVAEKALYNGRE